MKPSGVPAESPNRFHRTTTAAEAPLPSARFAADAALAKVEYNLDHA